MQELIKPKKRSSGAPTRLLRASKKGVRTQYGALCYRVKNGELQVLLITSRERQRWIIPKGWPVPGLSPEQGAGQEAWEEAGVRGSVKPHCIGIYTYTKRLPKDTLPCAVAVFPLKVKAAEKTFPEREERRRKWFNRSKAAKKVSEPELSALIRSFDPRLMRSALESSN